jgi:hypothetical protein
MVQKSNVFKNKVKQKGYWNFTELYNFCYDWLKDNGYKVKEKGYTEKLTSFGKELIIEWEIGKKVTDYYKNTMKMKWHILGMKDAEIEREGKKESTNKGEVGIELTADLETDYEHKWEQKPIWKFLRGIYDKYIVRTTTEEYEDRLEDDAKEFVEQIKSFLQIEGR